MTAKCCRSLPRCAGCPVRAAEAARRQRQLDEPAVLVSEILGGRPVRQLPQGVASALAAIELARILR